MARMIWFITFLFSYEMWKCVLCDLQILFTVSIKVFICGFVVL